MIKILEKDGALKYGEEIAILLEKIDEDTLNEWHTIKIVYKKTDNAVYISHIDLRYGEYDLTPSLMNWPKRAILKVKDGILTRFKEGF